MIGSLPRPSSGNCKKNINEQKSQLNRIGTPKWRVLAPCDYGRAQQEEERPLSFPGKDLANERPQALCLLPPSQLPFPIIEASPFLGLMGGDSWVTVVADHGLQSSADPEEIHRSGEDPLSSCCFRTTEQEGARRTQSWFPWAYF